MLAVKKKAVRALTPARIPAAIETMAESEGTARFEAGKALAATAAAHPGRVYPHLDRIAALLDSDSRIVRWNAMQTLARLAPVDAERKLDPVVGAFVRFIRGGNLITAANAIGGLAGIGKARPELLGSILPGILAVERARYETAECRRIAIGRALAAFAGLWPDRKYPAQVLRFIRRQRKSPRAAVARLARAMDPGARSH